MCSPWILEDFLEEKNVSYSDIYHGVTHAEVRETSTNPDPQYTFREANKTGVFTDSLRIGQNFDPAIPPNPQY